MRAPLIVDEGEQVGLVAPDARAVQGIADPAVVARRRVESPKDSGGVPSDPVVNPRRANRRWMVSAGGDHPSTVRITSATWATVRPGASRVAPLPTEALLSLRDLALDLGGRAGQAGLRRVAGRRPAQARCRARRRSSLLDSHGSNLEVVVSLHIHPVPHPKPRTSWRQRPRLVVVIPVHESYDDVVRCYDAVLAHTPLTWVPVVDDAGQDRRVAGILSKVNSRRRQEVVVLVHEQNTGFVGACNEAFARQLDVM